MLLSNYYSIDVLLFLRYYYSIILLLYYFSGCYYLTIVCRLFYLTRRWWLVAGRFALQGRCTLPDDGGTDAFSWHPGEFRRKVSPWPARGVRSLWRRKLFAGPDLVADFALSRRLRGPWLSFHPAYIVVIERSCASPNNSENRNSVANVVSWIFLRLLKFSQWTYVIGYEKYCATYNTFIS